MMRRTRILLLTIMLEGILVVSFAVWASLRGTPFTLTPSAREILSGVLYSLPLLLLNFLLFGPLSKRVEFLYSLQRFCNEIIKPLADKLDLVSAFLVSAAAGLGEELFFRGLLQTELSRLFANEFAAIVLSALMFAFLHFGVYVRRYFSIAVVYGLIGVYFGFLVYIEQSLWPAIICHALYDFIALLYLRCVYIRPAKHPCEL